MKKLFEEARDIRARAQKLENDGEWALADKQLERYRVRREEMRRMGCIKEYYEWLKNNK